MHTPITNARTGQIVIRSAAGLTGVAVIGCVTHYAVAAIGGYGAPGAPLLMAMSAGLVVGAAVVGAAWQGRKVLAGLMALALVCGEGYALLNTGERTLEQREARMEPVRRTVERRAQITGDIAKAEVRLAGMSTSHRLQQAEQVLARIEQASIEASTKKTCVRLCKQRLDDSVASARRDVDAARGDLQAERAGLVVKLEADKAALAALPVPGTQGILAATLGIEGWMIDLLAAALISIAANGLGALLVAFAAHPGRTAAATVVAIAAPANDAAMVLEPGPGTPAAQPRDDAIDFVRAYRARHGRNPQIAEVQAALNLSRTTAWRRIKAA